MRSFKSASWVFASCAFILINLCSQLWAQNNQEDCVYGVDLGFDVAEHFQTNVSLLQKDTNSAFILCQNFGTTMLAKVSRSESGITIEKAKEIVAPNRSRLFFCTSISSFAIGGPLNQKYDQIELFSKSRNDSSRLASLKGWQDFVVSGSGYAGGACMSVVIDNQDDPRDARVIAFKDGKLFESKLPESIGLPLKVQFTGGKLAAVHVKKINDQNNIRIVFFDISIKGGAIKFKKDAAFLLSVGNSNIHYVKDLKLSPDESLLAISTIDDSTKDAVLRVVNMRDNVREIIFKQQIGDANDFETLPVSWKNNRVLYFFWEEENRPRIRLESVDLVTKNRTLHFWKDRLPGHEYKRLNLGYIEQHGPIATWQRSIHRLD